MIATFLITNNLHVMAYFLNLISESERTKQQTSSLASGELPSLVPPIPSGSELHITPANLDPDLKLLLKLMERVSPPSVKKMGDVKLDAIPHLIDELVSSLVDNGDYSNAAELAARYGVPISKLPAAFWSGLRTPQLLMALKATSVLSNLTLSHRQLVALSLLSLAWGEGVYNPNANLRPRNWKPGQKVRDTASGMWGLLDIGYQEGTLQLRDSSSPGWIEPATLTKLQREYINDSAKQGVSLVAKDRLFPARDYNYPFVATALIADHLVSVLRAFKFNQKSGWVSTTASPVASKILGKMGRLRLSPFGGLLWLMVLYHTKSKYSALKNADVPYPGRASKDPVIAETLTMQSPLLSLIYSGVSKPLGQITSRIQQAKQLTPTAILTALTGDPSDDDISALVAQWNSIVALKYKHVQGAPRPLGTALLRSPFGMRLHPDKKERRMHYGLDLRARVPSFVFAPAEGVVRKLDYGGGWGRYLDLVHPELGLTTKYAHLSAVVVPVNTRVFPGMIIAITGSTQASAPHLHFEVWKNSTSSRIDPVTSGIPWKQVVNS